NVLPRQPRSAQILTADSVQQDSRSRLPGDQRSTTESTEIHGKENPNQLPLSVPFPGATPARRVGSFRGYPFVMIFLAWVIPYHGIAFTHRSSVPVLRVLPPSQ